MFFLLSFSFLFFLSFFLFSFVLRILFSLSFFHFFVDRGDGQARREGMMKGLVERGLRGRRKKKKAVQQGQKAKGKKKSGKTAKDQSHFFLFSPRAEICFSFFFFHSSDFASLPFFPLALRSASQRARREGRESGFERGSRRESGRERVRAD